MKQVIKSILLTILMSMGGNTLYAYDFEAGGIYYNLKTEDMTLEVTYGGDENGYNKYEGAVIIPSAVTYNTKTLNVTSIGKNAFSNSSNLLSVVIPNSVIVIKSYAFSGCRNLTSVTIGNKTEEIEIGAFQGTKISHLELPNSLKTIGSDAFRGTLITRLEIPNSVTSIPYSSFEDCSKLESIVFGSGLTSIGSKAFSGCKCLSRIDIPNNVKYIDSEAFRDCGKFSHVKIGNGLSRIGAGCFRECSIDSLTFVDGESSCDCDNYSNGYPYLYGLNIKYLYVGRYIYNFIGWGYEYLETLIIGKSLKIWETHEYNRKSGVFCGENVKIVKSYIDNPTQLEPNFPSKVYSNATLYVPKGTKALYEQSPGWKNFFVIEEGDGNGNNPPENYKCEKPTINFQNGKLFFNSTTEGVSYNYNISDTDIKAGCSQEVQLDVTYRISVYATKAGYENSETTTATLCWIDQQPTMEGISNNISQIPARAVLIQSQGGLLTIHGIEDGSNIVVYTLSGQMVGSTRASGSQASLATNIKKGEFAIVKIGDKSVKVLMQ